ncbi:hypothetical protein GVN21_16750 [Caulobacter sp. SLTY]|uniref:hypothetical protein n=1 Tax=Caulobacter sp. SLTY TaxID=2683262 RepID=UPI001412BA87|nr:hypothetical protein [Caulobacter sp. SLTY]NBB17017.1 hypothetical protein [Caulobacter sp. SLTY]
MSEGPIPLTANLAAVAIVASAKVYGDDPARALSPEGSNQHRRSVAPAAAALIGHTGQTAKAVCGLLQIVDTSFYTARTNSVGPFAAATAAAAAALAGVCPPYEKPERARRTPAAKPVSQDHLKPGRLTADATLLPNIPIKASPALKAATAAIHQLPPPPIARRTRAARAGSAYGRATTVRLKELTPRKLRYCRRFLNAGWALDEVADLFDVSADALAIQARGYAA